MPRQRQAAVDQSLTVGVNDAEGLRALSMRLRLSAAVPTSAVGIVAGVSADWPELSLFFYMRLL